MKVKMKILKAVVKNVRKDHFIYGITVTLQDEEQTTIVVTLYNFIFHDENPQLAIPPNSYVALLNPKYASSKQGQVHIECDNPQEFKVFESQKDRDAYVDFKLNNTEDVSLVPGTEDDFNKATETLKVSWHQAWRIYERLGEPVDLKACLACTRFHSRNENWRYVLKYAEKAKSMDGSSNLALYWMVLAKLMLRKPKEASALLKDLKDDVELPETVPQLRSKIEEAVAESCGNFNWCNLYGEATTSQRKVSYPYIEPYHCNFVSPNIKVVGPGSNVSQIGNGVVATKSMKAGTIIVVERASSYAIPRQQGRQHFEMMGHDLTRDAPILNSLVRKILMDPESSEDLYELSAGEEHRKKPKPAKGEIDPDRLNMIAQINCFSMGTCDQRQREEVLNIVNARFDRKKKQCQEAKVPASLLEIQQSEVTSEPANERLFVGLWDMISKFNHSCLPNAGFHNIGDFKIIYVAKNIEPGEEICFAYTMVQGLSVEERSQKIQKYLADPSFMCKCEMCETERRYNMKELHVLGNMVQSISQQAIQFRQGSTIDQDLLSRSIDLVKLKLKQVPLVLRWRLEDELSQWEYLLADTTISNPYAKTRELKLAVKKVEEYIEVSENYFFGSSSVILCLIRLGNLHYVLGNRKATFKWYEKALSNFCNLFQIHYPQLNVDEVCELVRWEWQPHFPDKPENAISIMRKVAKDKLPAVKPYCDFCQFRPLGLEMKCCSRCKKVHYCSVEHQRKDWKVHKQQCKVVAN